MTWLPIPIGRGNGLKIRQVWIRIPRELPIEYYFVNRSDLTMAYVYKIINNINEKVYIGKTYNSIEERWKEHCRDYKKRKNENRPLYSAMNKYGIECFRIELLEETDIPEEREKYWIEYYGSFKNGYNATIGGDGRPYVDKNIIMALWREGKIIKEIYNITGYDIKTIKKYLLLDNVTKQEILSNGYAYQGRAVAKIDKDTDEILEVFNTSGEAGKSIGKTGQHIRDVCLGERKTAYGYKWKYI